MPSNRTFSPTLCKESFLQSAAIFQLLNTRSRGETSGVKQREGKTFFPNLKLCQTLSGEGHNNCGGGALDEPAVVGVGSVH